jgi:hypothetical protein
MSGWRSLSFAFAVSTICFIALSTADSAELPLLDTNYCVRVNSKLLDPNEKAFETDKCLAEELAIKNQLIEHWSIVSDDVLKKCLKYSQGAYRYFQRCVAQEVGRQCFKGDLTCK